MKLPRNGAAYGVVLSILLGLLVPSVSKAESPGMLYNPYPKQKPVGSLKWTNRQVELRPGARAWDPNLQSEGWIGIVQGTFSRSGWALSYRGQSVPLGFDGSFTLEVPIRGKLTGVEVSARGPRGESEKMTMGIQVAHWDRLASKSPRTQQKQKRKDSDEAPPVDESEPAPIKSYALVPSLGVSAISYSETDIIGYHAISATGKLTLGVKLSPNWDLGGNAFMNLAPLVSNYSTVKVGFFGANLRIGWALPFITAPWRFSIMAGGYFSTMFIDGGNFGYSMLLHPELYPVLSYRFAGGNSLGIYGKYVPINGVEDREWASGFSLSFPTSPSFAWVVAFDYSSLVYHPSARVKMASESSSLSIGAAF